MSSRNLILLVIAAVLAVGTVMLIKSRMQAPMMPKQVAAPVNRVLVAKHAIEVGSFVKSSQDLDWAEWPVDNMQPGYVKEGSENINSFEGAVARHNLRAGDAIETNDLIKPGAGGFLSAVLDPGMRAVSIAVSATSGTAGFIFPGDHVDLIVTHHMKVKSSSNSEDDEAIVSETFVKDARVVAVDQMLDNPDNKAILAKTVTVEVTADQAQKISVAQDVGKISFALRSIALNAPVKPGEVKPAADNDNKDNKEDQDMVSAITEPQASSSGNSDFSSSLMHSGDISPRVRVIHGDNSEQREFYRGGQ